MAIETWHDPFATYTADAARLAHRQDHALVARLVPTCPVVASGDSTADLQAALAANQGGALVLPPGRYVFSTPLVLRGTDLTGQGAVTLDYRGAGPAVVVGDLEGSTVYSGVLVQNVTISGASAQPGAAGLAIHNATQFVLDRVLAYRCPGAGFDLLDACSGALRDCRANGCDIGLSMTAPAMNVNMISVDGGDYSNNRVGVQIGDATPPLAWFGDQIHLANVGFQVNTECGIDILDGSLINLDGCYFEDNALALRVGTGTSTPDLVLVRRNYFYNHLLNIDAVACTHLDVSLNYFRHWAHGDSVVIRQHSGVATLTHDGNYVEPSETEVEVV